MEGAGNGAADDCLGVETTDCFEGEEAAKCFAEVESTDDVTEGAGESLTGVVDCFTVGGKVGCCGEGLTGRDQFGNSAIVTSYLSCTDDLEKVTVTGMFITSASNLATSSSDHTPPAAGFAPRREQVIA